MAEKKWLCRRPTGYIVFTENLRKWVKAVKPGLNPREPLTAARHHLLKILNPSKITPPVEDQVSKQVTSTFHIQHSTFKPYHYLLLKLSYDPRSNPCEESLALSVVPCSAPS